MKGIFVTFEGTEGAGKSTLIRALASQLAQSPKLKRRKITITREPGGSRVAERIREVILQEAMDPWTELFLYEASRAEHLAQTVRPALAQGAIVLCDRYTDSSLAYQSHARGLPWKEVKRLNEFATRGLNPDLTVLLDVDPSTGLKRAREVTRFEKEGVAFQTRVRKGYLKSRAENPRRWVTLSSDRGQSPEELAAILVEVFEKRFGGGKKASPVGLKPVRRIRKTAAKRSSRG